MQDLDAGVMVQKRQIVTYTELSSLQPGHTQVCSSCHVKVSHIGYPSQLAYVRLGQPGTVGSTQLFQDAGITYMGYFQ